MRAVVLALLVTTACHTTVRSRTSPSGFVEEEGTCDSEEVGPHEDCTEQRKFDEKKTILGAAIVVATVIIAGFALATPGGSEGR